MSDLNRMVLAQRTTTISFTTHRPSHRSRTPTWINTTIHITMGTGWMEEWALTLHPTTTWCHQTLSGIMNTEDPYSFVDEETGASRSAVAPAAVESIKTEPTTGPTPKKRGRKKKILPEPVPRYYQYWFYYRDDLGIWIFRPPPCFLVLVCSSCSTFSFAHRDVESLSLPPMGSILPGRADAADGQPGKRKYTKSEYYKQRRRHGRFKSMAWLRRKFGLEHSQIIWPQTWTSLS